MKTLILTMLVIGLASTSRAADTNVASVSAQNCKEALSKLSPEAQAAIAEWMRLNNAAVRAVPGYGVCTNSFGKGEPYIVWTNNVRVTFADALAVAMSDPDVSAAVRRVFNERSQAIRARAGEVAAEGWKED